MLSFENNNDIHLVILTSQKLDSYVGLSDSLTALVKPVSLNMWFEWSVEETECCIWSGCLKNVFVSWWVQVSYLTICPSHEKQLKELMNSSLKNIFTYSLILQWLDLCDSKSWLRPCPIVVQCNNVILHRWLIRIMSSDCMKESRK